jgi:hypothetical protein
MIKKKRFLVTTIFSLVSHFSFSVEELHQQINQTIFDLPVMRFHPLSLFVFVLLDDRVRHCNLVVSYLFNKAMDRI